MQDVENIDGEEELRPLYLDAQATTPLVRITNALFWTSSLLITTLCGSEMRNHKPTLIGANIVISESPLQLKMKFWQPKFLNWSLAGNLRFSPRRLPSCLVCQKYIHVHQKTCKNVMPDLKMRITCKQKCD